MIPERLRNVASLRRSRLSGLWLLCFAKSQLNTALPVRPAFDFPSARVLTTALGPPYISTLRRADAHRRDGAPLKLHTTSRWERHPALSDACFDGSSVFRGGGLSSVPGCLKGKSEERETWTAESLRTACRREKSCSKGGRIRNFGGTRFRSTPLTVFGAQASRMFRGGTSSKRCDLPRSISSNLRV